jgi:hypothetical protein
MGFITVTDSRTMQVTLPLALGMLISLAFFWTLWRRCRHGIPWFELGAVYVSVITLYMIYPLLEFLVLQGGYTPGNDSRLFQLLPSTAQVARVAWLYLSHLAAFALAYLFARGRLPMVRPRPHPPSLFIVFALVVVFVSIEVFKLGVDLAFNTSARSYAESYAVARRLPLILAQLINHLGGMTYPISIALMTVLFTQYRTARPVIAGWLLVVTVLSVARLGSRTEVVLLLFAAAAMYHTLVKPLSARIVGAAAAVGLTGFVAFGMLRGGTLALNPFTTATEFESLFGTAIDIDRARRTLEHLPLQFYFADLTALIPQQILPFTKIEPASWYVTTFFPEYAASGGGLAFGTIAEAILTGGWPSALTRGAALGICFAAIHRFCLQRADSFWRFVFYLWITTLAYQAFRNTSFSILVLFVYRFCPTVALVTVLADLLRRVSNVRVPLMPPPISVEN